MSKFGLIFETCCLISSKEYFEYSPRNAMCAYASHVAFARLRNRLHRLVLPDPELPIIVIHFIDGTCMFLGTVNISLSSGLYVNFVIRNNTPLRLSRCQSPPQTHFWERVLCAFSRARPTSSHLADVECPSGVSVHRPAYCTRPPGCRISRASQVCVGLQRTLKGHIAHSEK
jgi:hypothetical protein